ncbi:MAG: purine-nucleoside phosphorylase [Elusimicrobia bacterium]|nr:purine-nucleoside phosphorylase [Elusimicrobiota bacterium]
MGLLENLEESKKFIEGRTKLKPEVALILGSGLSSIADAVSDAVRIPFGEIPHFTKSTVEGHKGELVIGKLSGRNVMIMAGRIHFYEGHTMKDITYPQRLMKHLGVEKLIITAAVGAVNKKFHPGDIMLIRDHINFMGENPLMGTEGALQGTRFPDMSTVYKSELIEKAQKCAKALKIKIQKGVYFAGTGPSYETPAEVNMARILGADVVGMSTVPEAIVANHCGIKVLGISYISNMAAGILKQPLNHQEVIAIGKKIEKRLSSYIKEIVKVI